MAESTPTIKFVDMYDTSEVNMNLEIPSRWIVEKDSTYYASGKIKTIKSLPAGQYSVTFERSIGACLVKRLEPKTDDLIEIDEQSADVVKEVLSFVDKIPLFKEHGVIPKRGIMFYGMPGQGKTSTCALIANSIIKNNGIIFNISSLKNFEDLTEFLINEFRMIEKDRLIIVIIEDIDEIAYEAAGVLTNFIDGQFNVSPVIFIATTNKIDRLPDTLLRPSRFDWLIKMTNPNEAQIKQYLTAKGIEGDELDTLLNAVKDMTWADIKELFICYKLLGNNLEGIIARLKNNRDLAAATVNKSTNNINSKKIGFN